MLEETQGLLVFKQLCKTSNFTKITFMRNLNQGRVLHWADAAGHHLFNLREAKIGWLFDCWILAEMWQKSTPALLLTNSFKNKFIYGKEKCGQICKIWHLDLPKSPGLVDFVWISLGSIHCLFIRDKIFRYFMAIRWIHRWSQDTVYLKNKESRVESRLRYEYGKMGEAWKSLIQVRQTIWWQLGAGAGP